MPTVKIPPVLRAAHGRRGRGQRRPATTVGEVLEALAEAHPDTREQLFAADGELNRYVNVYLNDEDVRVLDGLEHRGRRRRHRGHPARDGRRALARPARRLLAPLPAARDTDGSAHERVDAAEVGVRLAGLGQRRRCVGGALRGHP